MCILIDPQHQKTWVVCVLRWPIWKSLRFRGRSLRPLYPGSCCPVRSHRFSSTYIIYVLFFFSPPTHTKLIQMCQLKTVSDRFLCQLQIPQDRCVLAKTSRSAKGYLFVPGYDENMWICDESEWEHIKPSRGAVIQSSLVHQNHWAKTPRVSCFSCSGLTQSDRLLRPALPDRAPIFFSPSLFDFRLFRHFSVHEAIACNGDSGERLYARSHKHTLLRPGLWGRGGNIKWPDGDGQKYSYLLSFELFQYKQNEVRWK